MTAKIIAKSTFEEVVEVFEYSQCSFAVLPVQTSVQAIELLKQLVGWEVRAKTLTAKKQGKVLSFVYSKEHVYGCSYDFLGIIQNFPVPEDFAYYVSRLR